MKTIEWKDWEIFCRVVEAGTFTHGAELAEVPTDHTERLAQWLLERQPKLVTDDHWQVIDAHERSAGEPTGRPRVKLTSLAELLRIGHG